MQQSVSPLLGADAKMRFAVVVAPRSPGTLQLIVLDIRILYFRFVSDFEVRTSCLSHPSSLILHPFSTLINSGSDVAPRTTIKIPSSCKVLLPDFRAASRRASSLGVAASVFRKRSSTTSSSKMAVWPR